MAARSPRRSFATSFIITLAPACYAGSAPQTAPPQKTEPVPAEPTKPDTLTVVTNPPRPTPPPKTEPPKTEPPKTEPPKTNISWTVTRHGADCQAFSASACPHPPPGQPIPPCNPPPPMKYACPDNLADGASLTVTQLANQPDCFILPGPISCPPRASCNPPPPRKVACPHF
jgi:hypothetical protein